MQILLHLLLKGFQAKSDVTKKFIMTKEKSLEFSKLFLKRLMRKMGRFLPVLKAVEHHYAEKFTVTGMAEQMNLSTVYFSQRLHLTTLQYRRRIR